MLNRWQNKHSSLLNTWLATNTQWVCEDRFKYSLETGSSSIRLHTDSWTRTALFKASQAFSTGSRSELSSQWKQAFLCIFPSTRHYFSLKYIFSQCLCIWTWLCEISPYFVTFTWGCIPRKRRDIMLLPHLSSNGRKRSAIHQTNGNSLVWPQTSPCFRINNH